MNVDIAANDLGDTGPPAVVSGPADGTTTVEADGSITYAPTPGFTGTDTFDYQVCSTVSPTVCGQATVTIEVLAAPNQPPVVGDGTAATTATVQATGSVTVTDPDAGQTVTMSVAIVPANGTATVDDSGAFTYTPTGAFTGIDSFIVVGCDDGDPVLCDSGTVTVTVSPLAVDDAASTTDGVPVNVDIAANDLGDSGCADRRERARRTGRPPSRATVPSPTRRRRLHRHGHLRLPDLQHGLADGLRDRDGHHRRGRDAEPAAGRR